LDDYRLIIGGFTRGGGHGNGINASYGGEQCARALRQIFLQPHIARWPSYRLALGGGGFHSAASSFFVDTYIRYWDMRSSLSLSLSLSLSFVHAHARMWFVPVQLSVITEAFSPPSAVDGNEYGDNFGLRPIRGSSRSNFPTNRDVIRVSLIKRRVTPCAAFANLDNVARSA